MCSRTALHGSSAPIGPLKLYRAFALQSDLFKEHLLRPDGATVRDYRRDYKRLMIAEQLAASMPIGANAGGSDTGYHIGYTIPGARRPTRYDPTEASVRTALAR
jgi:hypothetical protein